ncbi:hypothetical protein HanPI659440_Chr07g0273191 [Helianthus annuus]|nr:hypothetical protein HanPI659440_Chr07g0273191 [Helianthus annuus]
MHRLRKNITRLVNSEVTTGMLSTIISINPLDSPHYSNIKRIPINTSSNLFKSKEQLYIMFLKLDRFEPATLLIHWSYRLDL